MRWSPCKNCPADQEDTQDDDYLGELQRKELALKQKEKELLKKDKILQRKITKFNKRKKNKAKNNLKAATKLRDARKMLLLTVDTKDKVRKCAKHSCKRNKSYARNDNIMQRKNRLAKVKRGSCSPVRYFSDLINKPRECSHGKKRQPSKETDLHLRKLFCRLTSCKYLNTDRGCSTCKSGQKSSRTSYWDSAAGDCYLMSMRRPPQLWLYNRCPQLYPQYLSARQQCKNVKNLSLCLVAILLLTPCLLCLQLCKCCFCACCTE